MTELYSRRLEGLKTKEGHGIYILSQAQNALNDVGEPPELWRGHEGREVKSH